MSLRNISTSYKFRFNDRVTKVEISRNDVYNIVEFIVDGEKAYLCKITYDELADFTTEDNKVKDIDVIRLAQKKLSINRQDWFTNCGYLTIYGNRMELFEKTESFKIATVKDEENGFYYLKLVERAGAPFQIRLTSSFNTDSVIASINAHTTEEILRRANEIIFVITGLEDSFQEGKAAFAHTFEEERKEIGVSPETLDYTVHSIFKNDADTDKG